MTLAARRMAFALVLGAVAVVLGPDLVLKDGPIVDPGCSVSR